MTLFLHAAHRVRPGYEPTADDLAQVARICDLVAGMPLAILLAAAWADALPVSEIAAQIEQGLGFLEAELRDLPERQRSMRAVFDASWRLLSEQERVLFPVLALFRGGFTAEAAHAVAGADLRMLGSLVRKSFLQMELGGRYQVHELLRQYGAEQLACSPEEERAAHDRHCAYYAAALRRWGDELRGPRQVQADQEMALESGNASAAWGWAVERERWADLEAAAEGLGLLYRGAGRYQEGKAAFEAVAARLEGVARERPGPRANEGPVLSTGEGARLLLRVTACQIPFAQDAETWQRLIERCESLLAHPDLAGQDTRPERVFFLREITVSDPTTSEQSLGYAREALALCQELGDWPGVANAHSILGIGAALTSDYEEAKRQFAQQLEISRSLGYQSGVGGALSWLATLATLQGQVTECERRLRELDALATELGVGLRIIPGMGMPWARGCADCLSGLYAQADAALEGHALVLREEGARIYLGRILLELSKAKTHLGLYDQARETGQEVIALARERGEPFHEGRAWRLLGGMGLAEGQAAAAMELFEQADAVCRAGGDRLGLAEVLAYTGYAARRLGQSAQARQSLAQALQLGIEIRSLLPLWAALPGVALLLADRGEAERAVELYALAWGVPAVARSRWYEDIAGRELAAVAARLPVQVCEAAQARGRARDLWATAQELLEELAGG